MTGLRGRLYSEMRSRVGSAWLHRFAWFTAVATLFLICSGGMVTSKNVGLAVPDWPTTFGYNMFFFPFSKWIGGIFFEHVHRLIASTVGFLTIILAIWLWRSEPRRWVRNLGYAALAAVIVQGVLGGLRVTLLKDEIGIFHACLAQAYLAILIVIALATSKFWHRLPWNHVASDSAHTLAWFSIVTSIIVYVQLALGATMRHQHRDLSILDFPLAYGQIIPDVSAQKLAAINAWRDARALSDVNAFQIWLQMAHRFVAVVIAACVIGFWFLACNRARESVALRRLSAWWVFLVACQITLGAWTIWSNKAADIATAHVAVGAIIFGVGVALAAICLQLARANSALESARRSVVPENAISP
jgi:cytochrome c oxidase assembly protein subunit 15